MSARYTEYGGEKHSPPTQVVHLWGREKTKPSACGRGWDRDSRRGDTRDPSGSACHTRENLQKRGQGHNVEPATWSVLSEGANGGRGRGGGG